ncbi:MAG: GNAT family N-acetyltransferase [Planctomycetes bacterium]|nr:GNAT family N-acetyltransferase [Planctomycetota bacterium]
MEIIASTGSFHDYEMQIAVELVDERLAKGPASGYSFVFAERRALPIGYACYGPIACTKSSFDIHWIAVRREFQGCGIGREILREVERRIAEAGGRRIYVDTSGRGDYGPTRAFYERCGYRVDALLRDFYAPGDDKVVFLKLVA